MKGKFDNWMFGCDVLPGCMPLETAFSKPTEEIKLHPNTRDY